MQDKTEEQNPESRELTTEELEAVAGGWMPGVAAAVASLHARRDPKYKCKVDPMACQW